MKVHFVVHESFEAPAAIEVWAHQRGAEISYSRLYEGDSLPSETKFDFLVVMGGPQSPETTIEECSHFDAVKEIDFIKKAIRADKHLLGVCLGAQLIGEALGAKFDHSPNKEIGVFPIKLTTEGRSDPIIGKLPEEFSVGHWHSDMPGLTVESKILAVSEGCPRQIVCYSSKIYGFQCHFEFTSEAVEGMIKNSTQELEKYKGLPYVETASELLRHDYSEMNNFLFRFLDDFIGQS